MKKTKILVFALSLALIITSLFAFGVSASENNDTPYIKAVNVAYGDRVQMLVAVEPGASDIADLTVTYTLNGEEYEAPLHPTETYGELPVYYTVGISPKDIADEVTFELKAQGAEVGSSYTASVATYLYARLYKDGIINAEAGSDNGKRKELYENCLAYAASAQEVLVNLGNPNPEALVTDYVFVWSADEAVLVNGVSAYSAFAPGSAVTPVYNGEGEIELWTLLDGEGNPLGTLAYGESLTVTEHTRLTPGEVSAPVEDTVTVMDYENGANNAFVSSKDADGNDVTGPWVTNTSLSMGLTTESDNTFLQVRNAANSGKTGVTTVNLSNTVQAGNCYTFGARINVKGATAGYNFAQLKFVNGNGGEALNLFLGYATVDGKTGVAIKTTGDNSSVTKGTALFDATDEVITTATGWFDLKLEFYFGGVGTENAENTYLKLYVNDTLVFDGQANWAMGASISHAQIDHISAGKTHNSCYDDIYFTRTEKAYSAGN